MIKRLFNAVIVMSSNKDFIYCMLKVWPLAGPLAGGTEIEIHGSDLGKSFDDIRESVSVSDLKCHPDQGKYEPSRR